MDDLIKARVNEIYFLELCQRIYNFRGQFTDVILYINSLKQFLDFDDHKISILINEIFQKRFQASQKELIHLLKHAENLKSIDIARQLNISPAKVCLILKEEMVLYPRASAEQTAILNDFMTQYKQLCMPDVKNLI